MSKRKILDARERKISMSISGSGSITPKVTLPITWLRKMGIDKENPQAIIEFDGESIKIIKKGSKTIESNISYSENILSCCCDFEEIYKIIKVNAKDSTDLRKKLKIFIENMSNIDFFIYEDKKFKIEKIDSKNKFNISY